MKEALFYERADRNAVRCRLCPHECVVAEGRTGTCGVRLNRGGRLWALTYGRVAAAAVDPIEKKPLYHFYPGARTFSVGTFGCNLRCKHCQNWHISHRRASEAEAELSNLSPEELVSAAVAQRCSAIAWTYNEPSIWIEYVLEGARLAHRRGLRTVLVTSGVINPAPLRALLNHIDAYRLDIKGFSEDFYARLTGSRVLDTVLQNALTARQADAHLEIVTNVIPNWNDSDEQLGGLSSWIAQNLGPETPWHVTAYHPAHQVTEPPTPRETLIRAREIGAENGLKHIYLGNLPSLEDENTRCPECGRTIIRRSALRLEALELIRGRCKHCGYRLGRYFDAEVPFERLAPPFPNDLQ